VVVHGIEPGGVKKVTKEIQSTKDCVIC